MIKGRSKQRELFARPEDEPKAQEIVDEVLGAGFLVDYTSLPKNVGVMGDEGVRGHTVAIISEDPEVVGRIIEDYDRLGRASSRICAETGAACRVVLDITAIGRAATQPTLNHAIDGL